ncbi:hypothetical protein Tco_1110888 [Tanacetum coccineum]|uniref:Reverse transcriptase domain-containing protein n=1 Tax=Tanacetum coccineum TaxID=301880 RepID=A0ABQ5ILJ8_9ASTR
MSADSAVTYTSVHSEARSWTIPSEDPYEEATRQLFEQVPRSPEYVLENHIPVYIPEPEHPEDLVPAEDEAPIPPLSPFFLSPPDIPEADTLPRKRLLLTTPRPSCEVGESSAAAAARQPGPTMAYRVDYNPVDPMETRLRDTERRMMTALELVNMRVTYQVDVCTRESSEFCTRHHDAQKDRAAVRAEIEVLRRERLAYAQESIETREALTRSEAHRRALEARVAVLETQAYHHEWQRQGADDHAVEHIMRTQALEARARMDTLEDTELWNLKVKGTDVVAYNQRFQELALLYDRMFPEETDKIERYVGGMPDLIYSSVVASKPKTMQEAIEMATELMDRRINTFAERQAENKRKFEVTRPGSLFRCDPFWGCYIFGRVLHPNRTPDKILD